ncbi:hypothetical protein [Phenylobacterium sp.]|uniref:hypothetical protein n=1 Tax=Phenylobacterium sp. TaxID=1871053 RepID=UPI003BAC86A8
MPERAWRRLDQELLRWEALGRACPLWWRDDDATEVTLQLERLVALSRAAQAPLLLSVIPSPTAAEIFPLIAEAPIGVAQHGVDHHNRLRLPRHAQFKASEPASWVAGELFRAGASLRGHRRVLPIYVAPWNRLSANLVAALPAAGFEAVSAFGGPVRAYPGLVRIDTHVDLFRWAPAPAFRGVVLCLHTLRLALRRRRLARAWSEPVGLLTHHLRLEAEAWDFLQALLPRLSAAPGVSWLGPEDLPGLTPQT